jgi:sortase (surface protein transpeptidase)
MNSRRRLAWTAMAALLLFSGAAVGMAAASLTGAFGFLSQPEPEAARWVVPPPPVEEVVPIVADPEPVTATPAATPEATPEAEPEPEPEPPQGVQHPARIRIAAIGVDAPLVGVGLLDNGEMEVPDPGLAGWYDLGPVPGAAGPSVIAAHVDSYEGPDVFFRLRELEPGDEIEVHGADGDVAVFTVEHSEQELKYELPADRIWNDTTEPVLRLITCGGEFDRSRRSYRSNIIVYAARSA